MWVLVDAGPNRALLTGKMKRRLGTGTFRTFMSKPFCAARTGLRNVEHPGQLSMPSLREPCRLPASAGLHLQLDIIRGDYKRHIGPL